MKLIGLSGYARSGKDTVADHLVEHYGFRKVAFADKLREVLYQLNPIVSPTEEKYFIGGASDFCKVQDVINRYGWDGYKETEYGPEIRRLLQRLGTEAGRDILGDNIWIDAAFAKFNSTDKIVIPDVRFFNEVDAVKEAGGQVWRVERDSITPPNAHSSETQLAEYKHFDEVLYNNHTIESLHFQVDGYMSNII